MAIKRVFTCASCDSEFDVSERIVPTNWAPGLVSWAYVYARAVCEGCFQDGVLDDININGDTARVNTSEVY